MTKPPQTVPRSSLRALRHIGGALALVCLPLAWPDASAADGPTRYASRAPIEQYLSTNPTAEIALARSAAPASIADAATVLVLARSGYETAVKGTNGFVCFVERSWANDFDHPQFWNPRLRTPQCWNAASVSSVLPEYLERTRWVLAGASTDDMLARTRAAWARHDFGPPAPGSMAYMMSREQLISDPTPGAPRHWYPHVMFFVPAAAGQGVAWGANVPGGPIYSTTSDVDPVTTYFVVVPKWSDGTPGPYATGTREPAQHHRTGAGASITKS